MGEKKTRHFGKVKWEKNIRTKGGEKKGEKRRELSGLERGVGAWSERAKDMSPHRRKKRKQKGESKKKSHYLFFNYQEKGGKKKKGVKGRKKKTQNQFGGQVWQTKVWNGKGGGGCDKKKAG